MLVEVLLLCREVVLRAHLDVDLAPKRFWRINGTIHIILKLAFKSRISFESGLRMLLRSSRVGDWPLQWHIQVMMTWIRRDRRDWLKTI